MDFVFLFLFGILFGFFDFMYFIYFFCFSLTFYVLKYGGILFNGYFNCDSLSFFLVYLTLMVFLFCFFSSFLEHWGMNDSLGFFLLLFLIFFFLILCFFSLSMFNFYVCFELIFMFMYVFVLGWGGSPERLQASFYMVFYTLIVSFPFLVYISFFEYEMFTLKFLCFSSFSFYWGVFLFLVFFVKLPVYMVHLWLPKAHVEAPISGSMVLAGVLLKLGGYGFLRFSFYTSGFIFKYSGMVVSVGLLGGLLSCFLCLRQADLKAFVAYSSVCHMGFGLGGLYSLSFFGFSGNIYMLVAHGFCSSCLFYLLFVFYERFHTRSGMLLKGIGGLIPSMMFFWFLFSVLNMGVPPSFSFFSEISLISGMVLMSMYTVFFIGLFLFFAGVYGIFFFVVSCHGSNLLSGQISMSLREYLISFGHGFPLLFLPFYLSFFF